MRLLLVSDMNKGKDKNCGQKAGMVEGKASIRREIGEESIHGQKWNKKGISSFLDYQSENIDGGNHQTDKMMGPAHGGQDKGEHDEDGCDEVLILNSKEIGDFFPRRNRDCYKKKQDEN